MSDEFTSGEIAAVADELSKTPEPASPAAHPEKTESASADTKAQPVSPEPVKAVTDGRIPLAEHKRVVDGFWERVNLLAWAEGLDPAEVREAIAQRKAASQPKPADVPQPDLQTEDGRRLYSADQAAARARWEVQQALDQFRAEQDQRLGPIEQERAQREHEARFVRDVQSVANLPQFNDHLDAMTKYVAEMNQRRQNGEPIPELSARDVYMAVVIPKLASREADLIAKGRQAALDDLDKSTSRSRDDINPGKRPAVSKKADHEKDWDELIEETVAELSARR
jgi:hypothetical protein